MLFPLFVLEPQSMPLRNAAAALEAGEALISDWSLVEFASAIGVNVRAGRLSSEDGRSAVGALMTTAEDFAVMKLERVDFEAARNLIGEYSSGLRGGDALHLAVAQRTRATLWTRDRGLERAARRFGVALYR